MRRIQVEEVWCSMNRMRIRKASWPSGIAMELFKAGGDKCLIYLTNIFNDILDAEFISTNSKRERGSS